MILYRLAVFIGFSLGFVVNFHLFVIFPQKRFYIFLITQFFISGCDLSHAAAVVILAKHYVSIISAVTSKISDLRGVFDLSNIVLVSYNSLL